jgi:hypothetical protein
VGEDIIKKKKKKKVNANNIVKFARKEALVVA